MPDGDGAAPGVDARVVIVDAEVVEERDDLDRERLVQLEQTDVGDGQPRLAEGLLRGRDRTDAHDLGLHSRVGEGDHPHLGGQAQFLHRATAREQRHRGAVGQRGRRARGHTAVRTERRLEASEVGHRGLRPPPLVLRGQTPRAVRVLDGDGDEIGLDLPRVVGALRLLLAEHAEAVGPLLRQVGEAVEDALGRHPHVQGAGVHHLLRDEARVGVGVRSDRVTTHVLDASCECDVVHADADRCGHRRHARHRSGAHAIDREPGNALGEACQDRHGPAEGESLVARLRGGRDGDIVDPVLRDRRVPLHQTDGRLDREVVGSGVPVHAFFAGAPERCAHAVDEEDVRDIGHSASNDWDRRKPRRPLRAGRTRWRIPTNRSGQPPRALARNPQRHP